ncbi:hypothetical protein GC170_06990 [bacterium]|nr:hypothetical protein [bacterium]
MSDRVRSSGLSLWPVFSNPRSPQVWHHRSGFLS